LLSKVTSFGGGTNANAIKYADNNISLSPAYHISLLATNKNKQIIDVWHKQSKTFTPYFVLKMDEKESVDEEQHDKKLEIINEKIKNNTSNAELYLQRGVIYVSLNMHEKALLDFNTSISLNKTDYMAYFARANMFHLLLNEDENMSTKIDLIIKDYEKCMELNPKFTYAYFNKGMLEFQQSKYIEAIEDFSSAIYADATFAEAFLNRGLILLILNNNEQACKDLSSAGELGIPSVYQLINRYCN